MAGTVKIGGTGSTPQVPQVQLNADSVEVSGNLKVASAPTGCFTTPTGQVVTYIDGIIVDVT